MLLFEQTHRATPITRFMVCFTIPDDPSNGSNASKGCYIDYLPIPSISLTAPLEQASTQLVVSCYPIHLSVSPSLLPVVNDQPISRTIRKLLFIVWTRKNSTKHSILEGYLSSKATTTFHSIDSNSSFSDVRFVLACYWCARVSMSGSYTLVFTCVCMASAATLARCCWKQTVSANHKLFVPPLLLRL